MVGVTGANYIGVLKGQMADRPGLAGRIGSKGFRLAGIQDIVEACNGK